MSELTTIARPYAQAAFDFAVEKQNLVGWQEMLTFAAQISCNATVKQWLTSTISPAQLADKFIAISGEMLDEYGQNFIKVLAENHRLAALPQIVRLFEQYQAEHDAVANVEVISAQSLSEQQQEKIIEAMTKRLARKVILHCSIDKSIMAGVIIRYGDMVIDGSIRGRLQRLANTLQS